MPDSFRAIYRNGTHLSVASNDFPFESSLGYFQAAWEFDSAAPAATTAAPLQSTGSGPTRHGSLNEPVGRLVRSSIAITSVISAKRVRNSGRILLSVPTTTAVRANSHPLSAINLIASSARSWPLELLSVDVTDVRTPDWVVTGLDDQTSRLRAVRRMRTLPASLSAYCSSNQSTSRRSPNPHRARRRAGLGLVAAFRSAAR